MMPTCRELTELVTDYVEGRMSFVDRIRLQVHLGMCRHCRAYLRQFKRTIRELGELPREAMPPELERVLLEQFRNWRQAPSGTTPSRSRADETLPGEAPDPPLAGEH